MSRPLWGPVIRVGRLQPAIWRARDGRRSVKPWLISLRFDSFEQRSSVRGHSDLQASLPLLTKGQGRFTVRGQAQGHVVSSILVADVQDHRSIPGQADSHSAPPALISEDYLRFTVR